MGIGGEGVRVHLTKHQPDPQADDMSCRPAIVPLLTTRYLYWGWGGTSRVQQGVKGVSGGIGVTYEKMKMVYCKVLLKT